MDDNFSSRVKDVIAYSKEEALEQYHTQQKVAEIDENLPIWIDDTGV